MMFISTNYDIYLNILSLSCELLLMWCFIVYVIYMCFFILIVIFKMLTFNVTLFLFLCFLSSMCELMFNYSGNLFYFLIFFESCMLGLMLNYVYISILLDDPRCIEYGLIMVAVAAVESAIGLSLVLLYQRLSGYIFFLYSFDG